MSLMFQKLLKIERKHQRPKWKVGKRYEPFTKKKKKKRKSPLMKSHSISFMSREVYIKTAQRCCFFHL